MLYRVLKGSKKFLMSDGSVYVIEAEPLDRIDNPKIFLFPDDEYLINDIEDLLITCFRNILNAGIIQKKVRRRPCKVTYLLNKSICLLLAYWSDIFNQIPKQQKLGYIEVSGKHTIFVLPGFYTFYIETTGYKELDIIVERLTRSCDIVSVFKDIHDLINGDEMCLVCEFKKNIPYEHDPKIIVSLNI